MEEIWIALTLFAGAIGVLGLYVWAVSWAIADAQKRGQTGCLPMFLFYVFGPLAVVTWLAIRPQKRLVERKPEEYSNPDDALAAASRLDMQGNWDEALNLYRLSAERWPEHRGYIEQCVAQIDAKRGRAEGG